jgi:hypothetical protein
VNVDRVRRATQVDEVPDRPAAMVDQERCRLVKQLRNSLEGSDLAGLWIVDLNDPKRRQVRQLRDLVEGSSSPGMTFRLQP